MNGHQAHEVGPACRDGANLRAERCSAARG